MADGYKTGGRKAGTKNKATVNAREAVASFVEGNVDRLNGWLDGIANGEKIIDEEGLEQWIRRPDPQGAFKAFMDVVEYHIPKLQRAEHVGPNGGAIETNATVTFVNGKLSDPE